MDMAIETCSFSRSIQLGKAILRPHLERDRESFVAAERDPEFYRMLGSEVPIELTRVEEAEVWFRKKSGPVHCWAIEADARCIGSIWIHSIEPLNRRGRLAIEIFNRDYRGRGIGMEATAAVVRVAFEQIRLHRLDLRVLTVNERAIRCYERCGFKREGIWRDSLLLDGVWYSDLWMSILETEYRAL